jgi:hypothetical protein
MHRNAITWTFDWLDWFSLIIIITDFINSLLELPPEKEHVAISLIEVFSMAGCLLPLFC